MDQPTTAAPTRVFKCVPLNTEWTVQGTSLDLKAIYRRPRRVTGEYDDVTIVRSAEGVPLWDITAPLPMRRHSDWTAKGYEYVTLADRESLEKAAPYLHKDGLRPAEYLQHPIFGPWNPKLYLATVEAADREELAKLRALVRKFGSDATLEIRRASDPSFTLPPALQHVPPGGPIADETTLDLALQGIHPLSPPLAAAPATPKRVRPSRAKPKTPVGGPA